MFASIRQVLSRKALAFAFLSSLILLLAMACASETTQDTQEPPASAGTPFADGVVQTPVDAATPTPSSTPEATPEVTGESQSTVADSKGTSESVPRSGETVQRSPAVSSLPGGRNGGDEEAESGQRSDATGGGSQAASVQRSGGNDDDGKEAPFPRSDGTSEDNQAPPIPDKGELKYPNLGSRLDELVARVAAGQATAEEAASGAAMQSGASVAVTIYLSGGADEVVAFLEENGGDPRNWGEDYVEAYVPVSLLGSVSELPGVIRVREIIRPAPGSRG